MEEDIFAGIFDNSDEEEASDDVGMVETAEERRLLQVFGVGPGSAYKRMENSWAVGHLEIKLERKGMTEDAQRVKQHKKELVDRLKGIEKVKKPSEIIQFVQGVAQQMYDATTITKDREEYDLWFDFLGRFLFYAAHYTFDLAATQEVDFMSPERSCFSDHLNTLWEKDRDMRQAKAKKHLKNFHLTREQERRIYQEELRRDLEDEESSSSDEDELIALNQGMRQLNIEHYQAIHKCSAEEAALELDKLEKELEEFNCKERRILSSPPRSDHEEDHTVPLSEFDPDNREDDRMQEFEMMYANIENEMSSCSWKGMNTEIESAFDNFLEMETEKYESEGVYEMSNNSISRGKRESTPPDDEIQRKRKNTTIIEGNIHDVIDEETPRDLAKIGEAPSPEESENPFKDIFSGSESDEERVVDAQAVQTNLDELRKFEDVLKLKPSTYISGEKFKLLPPPSKGILREGATFITTDMLPDLFDFNRLRRAWQVRKRKESLLKKKVSWTDENKWEYRLYTTREDFEWRFHLDSGVSHTLDIDEELWGKIRSHLSIGKHDRVAFPYTTREAHRFNRRIIVDYDKCKIPTFAEMLTGEIDARLDLRNIDFCESDDFTTEEMIKFDRKTTRLDNIFLYNEGCVARDVVIIDDGMLSLLDHGCLNAAIFTFSQEAYGYRNWIYYFRKNAAKSFHPAKICFVAGIRDLTRYRDSNIAENLFYNLMFALDDCGRLLLQRRLDLMRRGFVIDPPMPTFYVFTLPKVGDHNDDLNDDVDEYNDFVRNVIPRIGNRLPVPVVIVDLERTIPKEDRNDIYRIYGKFEDIATEQVGIRFTGKRGEGPEPPMKKSTGIPAENSTQNSCKTPTENSMENLAENRIDESEVDNEDDEEDDNAETEAEVDLEVEDGDEADAEAEAEDEDMASE